jgi:hypothetical protein
MSQSIDARKAAALSLVAAASKVNEALSSFSGWLMAGIGAAFSLLLANVEKVSEFILASHIRYALLLLLVCLVISVFAKLLSALVSSALGSHEAGEVLAKEIASSGQIFDVNLYITEFERGLFPYQRWMARKTLDKAKAGDSVASARLIAKLSQVQAMLVLLEASLVIVAAGTLVCGLKIL